MGYRLPMPQLVMHRLALLGLAVGLAVLGTQGGRAGAQPSSAAGSAVDGSGVDGDASGGRADGPAGLQNGTYQTLPLAQAWSNTGLITTDDDWTNVPGILGHRGDDLTTATGTDPQTILADGSGTPLDVIANQTNPNTLTTGGVAEFEITDPVVAFQGSGTADAPFLLAHINTSGVCHINVAYALRDIDGSADNAVQPVALQFRVGTTGNYTNVAAGFVADATTGPNLAVLVTNVNVELPVAADNQPQVQIRIMTANAVGNDEWVGVDDLSITAGSCAFTPTPTATPIPTPEFLPENTSFTITDPFDCTAAGDTLDAELAFTNSGDAPAVGAELSLPLPQRLVGVSGTCTFTGGSGGTCTIDEAGVHWRGTVPSAPPNNLVTLNFRLRVAGGTVLGTEICATATLGYSSVGTGPNDRTLDIGACTEVTCLPTVDPNRQLGGQVHLPILDFQGQDDVCQTWIHIQYLGCDPAKAVLVTWGAPGFCPPQAAGPLKVECTGMLVPGATWTMSGAQVPTGSKSGIVFKFSARSLSELGIDLGFDDVVADMMCEELFFGIVGDADDYRRFKKAYNEGLEFRGIPLRLATGDGYMAIEVMRQCPGDLSPGVMTTSKYNGIAGTHLGTYDPVFGGFGYYAPLIYAAKAGFDTILYIQNGGLECSSVEIWFKAQDDCLRATICDISTLAPGETFQFDASDCVGPDWQGSAWIRSSEPMGVVVDIVGRDLLMTYVGEPAELNFTFDPNKAYATAGNQVAYGPLIYSEYQGWDSGVQVMNLNGVYNAKVKVYFLDRSGDVITTLVDWICPRGSQTYFLPVLHNLPGNWVGSVRVESQDWWAAGAGANAAPNLVGIVTLIKYTDAARTQAAEAVAYNLLPEHKAFDWQVGANAGGLESGVGLIAIPSLLKDLEQQGVSSEIAIQNVVPKPGFTDFAIYLFDQNGLLDYVCQKLHDRQVEYMDMRTWGYVGPGFKGSAIISATFWEHDVFDNSGFFLRNLVGLSAMSIARTGTRQGEDIPGDESAASRGIPFTQRGIDQPFAYCFAGPAAAFCPGQPGVRPSCPDKLVFDGQGGLIPDDRAGGEMFVAHLGVNFPAVPGQCKVEDVNVFLEIEHDVLQDLDVFLDHAQVRGELFTDICGFEANVLTTLDDDALAPIQSQCPPVDDGHYQTESLDGLNRFDGVDPKGLWSLMIDDDFESNIGKGDVLRWRLILDVGEAR